MEAEKKILFSRLRKVYIYIYKYMSTAAGVTTSPSYSSLYIHIYSHVNIHILLYINMHTYININIYIYI